MDKIQSNETLNQWRESARFWAQHSATIRQMFAPLTQALIEDAAIAERQTVLDVAGGTGEPSLTIAEVVGPKGSVTCTDAIAEMVKAAEAEASRRRLQNLQFRQCPAEALPFTDDTFDVTVSRLGAMFFDESAFAEIVRVTKPGGRIALAVWRRSDVNPFCYTITDVMARHVDSPPPDPDAPGAFRFAEPGKLAGVLSKAGAIDLQERIFTFEIAAPISAREFWQMRSDISESLRTQLAKLPATERSQIATEVEAAAQNFFPENQMKFPAEMLIVTGRKPD